MLKISFGKEKMLAERKWQLNKEGGKVWQKVTT